MKENTKKLVVTALFAALIYIGTRYIQIPLVLGYLNVGDCFILLLSWSVGGVYGMFGAGLAAGLADVLSGLSVYAPVTIVIKAVMARVGCFGYVIVRKKSKLKKMIGYAVSGILAESIMVMGYFVFECCLYGAPMAIGALLGNVMQGMIAVVVGLTLIAFLEGTNIMKKIRK